jgi:hypothetical protein
MHINQDNYHEQRSISKPKGHIQGPPQTTVNENVES